MVDAKALLAHHVFLSFVLVCINLLGFCSSCERLEKRKVPQPDKCKEECGMFDIGIKCTNLGCYKPQRWSCSWRCEKVPPIEVEVRKCCIGYEPNAKGSCIDVDECRTEASNGCWGCVNTPGSFRCVCNRGYRPEGPRGDCVDVDECQTGKAACTGVCVNTPGSFYCLCPDGFELGEDRKSCEDVDECLTGQARCSDICLNTHGSYQCGCSPGYEISVDNGVRCVDTDECASFATRKCSHYCHNTNGSFYCSCPDTMVLSTDMRNCIGEKSLNRSSLRHVREFCIDIGGEDRCALVIALIGMAMAFLIAFFVYDKVKQHRRVMGVGSQERVVVGSNNNSRPRTPTPNQIASAQFIPLSQTSSVKAEDEDEDEDNTITYVKRDATITPGTSAVVKDEGSDQSVGQIVEVRTAGKKVKQARELLRQLRYSCSRETDDTVPPIVTITPPLDDDASYLSNSDSVTENPTGYTVKIHLETEGTFV